MFVSWYVAIIRWGNGIGENKANHTPSETGIARNARTLTAFSTVTIMCAQNAKIFHGSLFLFVGIPKAK
jgi:hypothetical protein